VADKFFKEANAPLDARIRHYFVDSSLTPLLVQENYLTAIGAGGPAPQQQMQALNRAASAAEAIAQADVIGTRIVREQQWGLAPVHGVMSCAKPGWHAAGHIGQLKFPSWLGRNSTFIKRQRLLREVSSHIQPHISGSRAEIRASYLAGLRRPLVRGLETRGADAIDDTIELMDQYSLTKDDFDTILEMQLSANGVPEGNNIPSNVKAGLTRQYNKTHLAAQKLSKGSAGGGVGGRFNEDGIAVDDDPEDEEDVDEDDKLLTAKPKKPAAKGKAKTAGKSR